jgi:CDP-diacylglycerol--glycerol-3-phosphate 3-phosphatidyltransferase
MKKSSYYFVNAITFYRLFSAPVLILLVIENQYEFFKWMLAVSFFTDAIDGPMARRYQVTSIFGSKLDSISDDLTIAAGMIGMYVFKRDFIIEHLTLLFFLLALFIIQMLLAMARYGKVSSFHTYSAKLAAVLQGLFLLAMFFLATPMEWLFYVAVGATAMDLVEEIILVLILPEWKANVRGIFWVMKERKQNGFEDV